MQIAYCYRVLLLFFHDCDIIRSLHLSFLLRCFLFVLFLPHNVAPTFLSFYASDVPFTGLSFCSRQS